MVYLDASVLVALVCNETSSDAVAGTLRPHGADLCISDFAAVEVSAAVSRRVRMRLEDEASALARLEGFDEFKADLLKTVTLQNEDVRHADLLVRAFQLQLRAPDALHVAMCLRLDATLATLDKGLAEAANALGIELVRFSVGET